MEQNEYYLKKILCDFTSFFSLSLRLTLAVFARKNIALSQYKVSKIFRILVKTQKLTSL